MCRTALRATYLQSQADLDNYNAGPRDTRFLPDTVQCSGIPSGTTISAIDLALSGPTYIDISAPTTAGIAAPVPISRLSPATSFLMVPTPEAPPIVTTAIWGGAVGAVATLNSALRKTGEIAQTSGNSANSLQQLQDHATQSIDNLNGGIGSLVDADMGKVSAALQSLQIQQQLAPQSLSIGNQWPTLLLQLFEWQKRSPGVHCQPEK